MGGFGGGSRWCQGCWGIWARVVMDELMGGAERGGVCGERYERSSDSPVEQRTAARHEPLLPWGAEVAAKR